MLDPGSHRCSSICALFGHLRRCRSGDWDTPGAHRGLGSTRITFPELERHHPACLEPRFPGYRAHVLDGDGPSRHPTVAHGAAVVRAVPRSSALSLVKTGCGSSWALRLGEVQARRHTARPRPAVSPRDTTDPAGTPAQEPERSPGRCVRWAIPPGPTPGGGPNARLRPLAPACSSVASRQLRTCRRWLLRCCFSRRFFISRGWLLVERVARCPAP